MMQLTKIFLNKSNIWRRIYKSGKERFQVRVQSKNMRYSISFATEGEACEWLNKHYYKYVKDPKKYMLDRQIERQRQKKW
jgi:hypothetical protein